MVERTSLNLSFFIKLSIISSNEKRLLFICHPSSMWERNGIDRWGSEQEAIDRAPLHQAEIVYGRFKGIGEGGKHRILDNVVVNVKNWPFGCSSFRTPG